MRLCTCRGSCGLLSARLQMSCYMYRSYRIVSTVSLPSAAVHRHVRVVGGYTSSPLAPYAHGLDVERCPDSTIGTHNGNRPIGGGDERERERLHQPYTYTWTYMAKQLGDVWQLAARIPR